MREWQSYKNLGDVVTIIMGQSPSSDTYNDKEGLPFFQGNADFGKEHPTVRVFCNSPIRIAEPNDILISVRAPIGAINIADRQCCIGRGLAAIRGANSVSNRFLYFFLTASKNTLISQGTGSTFKSIGKDALKNLQMPVFNLNEQERIVSELDLLAGIIDKQKQQLKELDTLAQSIFYDMFGNPVENEKGWHCMNLREIASFKNGLNYTNKKSGRLVKVLGVSDFQNRSFVDSSEIGCVHIDDCFDDDYYLNDDDIVFVRSNGSKALIGRSVRVLTQGENITYSGYCIRCRITSPLIISPYLAAFVKTEQIHNVLTTGGRGCNIQNLNQTTLGDLIIPIPPLAIQNSFTKKIQSIESQKRSINRSLAESQKLFDYTMDKYFG